MWILNVRGTNAHETRLEENHDTSRKLRVTFRRDASQLERRSPRLKKLLEEVARNYVLFLKSRNAYAVDMPTVKVLR